MRVPFVSKMIKLAYINYRKSVVVSYNFWLFMCCATEFLTILMNLLLSTPFKNIEKIIIFKRKFKIVNLFLKLQIRS